MLGTVLVILIILWTLGFIQIPGLVIKNFILFRFMGHAISLWEILMFIVIAWAMESLPTPLRQVAFVLVILWILSILGIIAVSGLSNLIVIALIIGLILAVFQG